MLVEIAAFADYIVPSFLEFAPDACDAGAVVFHLELVVDAMKLPIAQNIYDLLFCGTEMDFHRYLHANILAGFLSEDHFLIQLIIFI